MDFKSMKILVGQLVENLINLDPKIVEYTKIPNVLWLQYIYDKKVNGYNFIFTLDLISYNQQNVDNVVILHNAKVVNKENKNEEESEELEIYNTKIRDLDLVRNKEYTEQYLSELDVKSILTDINLKIQKAVDFVNIKLLDDKEKSGEATNENFDDDFDPIDDMLDDMVGKVISIKNLHNDLENSDIVNKILVLEDLDGNKLIKNFHYTSNDFFSYNPYFEYHDGTIHCFNENKKMMIANNPISLVDNKESVNTWINVFNGYYEKLENSTDSITLMFLLKSDFVEVENGLHKKTCTMESGAALIDSFSISAGTTMNGFKLRLRYAPGTSLYCITISIDLLEDDIKKYMEDKKINDIREVNFKYVIEEMRSPIWEYIETQYNNYDKIPKQERRLIRISN